jgi:hypothetical protein
MTRNQQIVTNRMRNAADQLEYAFNELESAAHDARTSPDVELTRADMFGTLELGAEPEQMIARLRALADWYGPAA